MYLQYPIGGSSLSATQPRILPFAGKFALTSIPAID
jgi:hypothetical protein